MWRVRTTFLVVAVTVLISGLVVVAYRLFTPPPAVPSFPGAEGFGATTPGGRGGKVLHVTSLDDSGPGSLRAALEASGPRIVVFDTGGTIELSSSIEIKNPHVTIAGQTAPGDGIALRMRPSQSSGLFDVNTHDVIIRGIRFRQGAHEEKDAAIPLEIAGGAARVVIDHNSLSWATDEVLTTYDDTADITISWNIIAEGLSHSRHYEGEHSRGLFISGDDSRNISAHHNLLAHNMRRNPEVAIDGVADIRNNVIYNYGTHATVVSDKRDSTGMNVIGNFYKPGPDSAPGTVEIAGYADGTGMPLHTAGNLRANGQPARLNANARMWLSSAPVPAPPVTTTGAARAYTDVLTRAGARAPRLDAVDARVLADIRRGTGRIIDDPAEVGGWPTLAPGAAPADTDADGMPDAWEAKHGLDPNADDSAADRDRDGYTNVEDYVNALLPTQPDGRPPTRDPPQPQARVGPPRAKPTPGRFECPSGLPSSGVATSMRPTRLRWPNWPSRCLAWTSTTPGCEPRPKAGFPSSSRVWSRICVSTPSRGACRSRPPIPKPPSSATYISCACLPLKGTAIQQRCPLCTPKPTSRRHCSPGAASSPAGRPSRSGPRPDAPSGSANSLRPAMRWSWPGTRSFSARAMRPTTRCVPTAWCSASQPEARTDSRQLVHHRSASQEGCPWPKRHCGRSTPNR